MADSKDNVFGVGEVIDIIRFRDLEKLLQVTAYVCRFVANLKLQKKGDELIVGQLRVAEICEAEKNVGTLWSIDYFERRRNIQKIGVIIKVILRQWIATTFKYEIK